MSNIYPFLALCLYPVLVCNSITVQGIGVGEIINCLLVLVLVSFGDIQ